MIKNSKISLCAIATVAVLFLAVVSCKKDFSDMDLQGVNPDFDTDVAYFKVFAQNQRTDAVQTNGLPLYKLGKYSSTIYGEEQSYVVSQLTLSTTSPRFGLYSQATEDIDDDELVYTEDEEEEVTRVYLDIPFFSSFVTDEDGIVEYDDDEVPLYKLDSIYGDSGASFDVHVQELTYYLGDFEAPDFTQNSKYYSSDASLDFMNYVGQEITMTQDNTNHFDGLDSSTIKIFDEDDPDTEDINESENVSEVLTPRLRIDLDTQFFQEKIIDMEDAAVFKSNNNFKEYLRGIVISTENFSSDLLMLLDFANANVTIEYDYKTHTTGDNGTVEVGTNSSSFELSLSGQLIQRTSTPDFPDFPATDDAELLYLKGGQGSYVALNLFEEDDLQLMRDENWLINEANLTFYVDRDVLQGSGVIEANRIYLFNIDEESVPLLDFSYDGTTNTALPYYSKYVHGGIVEVNDDGNAIQYKIRLTEHLNNIVRNDSTNVKLGLSVISNINSVVNSSSGGVLNQYAKIGTEETMIPRQSVIDPSGTVLYGSAVSVPEDKRLRLEVFYTKPSN